MSRIEKSLPSGAYTPEFQGHRQRLDRGLLAAVMAIVPRECSVIDLGCGIGKLVGALRHRGYVCDGVDGTPGIAKLTNGLVMEADLCSPEFADAHTRQWVWGVCTEVGEHIPPEFEGVFLWNLSRMVKRGMLITWADRDARGYGHVNCRTQVYVASRLAGLGFTVNDELTQLMRSKIRPKYRQRAMVVLRG